MKKKYFYLPSTNEDLTNIFIYKINKEEIFWDDDEKYYYIDFLDKDEDNPDKVIDISITVILGDPDEYTNIIFDENQLYSTMKDAKRNLLKKLYE